MNFHGINYGLMQFPAFSNQANDGRTLLLRLSRLFKADDCSFSAIMISTRPDLLIKQKFEPVTLLSKFNVIFMNELSTEASRRYLTTLYNCVDETFAVKSRKADIQSILTAVSGARSPFMLLMAFAAAVEASYAGTLLSPFLVYRYICTTCCSQTLSESIKARDREDDDRYSEDTLRPLLEILLMCYAAALRLVSPEKLLTVLPEDFMWVMFGEAAVQLQAYLDQLCELFKYTGKKASLPFVLLKARFF
jgi:hypothetical protein